MGGSARRRAEPGRLRAAAAAFAGLALWIAPPRAALASELVLVEGASPRALRLALEDAGLRALVEIGREAAIVELGAGQRGRLLLPGLRVVGAADAELLRADASRAERVFRLALETGPGLRAAEPPPCGTRSESESLEQYRALIASSPWLRELEARLGPLLEERGAGAGDGDSILDRYIQMRGKVGVVVFFLESDATAGNDEDWAAADVDELLAGVVRGALGWTRVAPLQPGLSFSIAYYGPETEVAAISTEPSHDVPESQWIHQALANAGFDLRLGPGAYPFEIAAFSRWARDELFDADVAFPVFAITDKLHPTEWGEPGWPHVNPLFTYMVLNSTYRSGVVFAHEVGHIFYADDEYAANSLYCLCVAQPVGNIRVRESGGAIGRTNANCENCNPEPQRCIMLSNAWLGGAIQGPDACWHSRAQIGWYATGSLHVEVQAPPELPSEQVDITLDGVPIGSTAARRYLEPGDYLLDVHAEGYSADPPMPRAVRLASEDELRFDVSLTPYSTRSASIR
jgi:hypothetical protein